MSAPQPRTTGGTPATRISYEALRAPVAAELQLVQRRLDTLVTDVSGLVSAGLRHVLSAGGKRLRPLICLLSAQAGCGEQPPPERVDLAVTCAVVVELVHTASLLHDDVVDEGDMRRGRETARARWGNPVSVLLGDYLAALAYRSLCVEGCVPALEELSLATQEMCQSELTHADRHGQPPDEDIYLSIVSGKTAALIRAAATTGAWAAGANDAMARLGEYGYCVGMAFQIGDDLLDLYGDPAQTGKACGSDLASGLVTLPVIRALAVDTSGELAPLVAEIESEGVDGQRGARIATLVESLGGREYAQMRMRAYASAAQGALGTLPESAACSALHDLADFVCEREA